MRDHIIQALRDEAAWAGDFLILPGGRSPDARREEEAVESGLEGLRLSVMECISCPLARTRKNVVFGEGNPDAPLMFIGEGPGAHEDETGRPFVGNAGDLLTKIIRAMGLTRQDVYIANIVKCRPPGNRDPRPEEVAACIGHLQAQIRAIRPRVIVALGRIAAQTLLAVDTPISRLRGSFRDCSGIMLMPTYHPSYLLQNPSKKRDVWEDIKKVMEVLGIPVQQGQS
ncbi:MAG TPA: uracil-DNA glycosylase [Deltaproteobacteria bacterium]|nr:uracil-DNA glycosylase [Deltaproteobacteria bacterium]HQI82070.1 uracil-DNA glycosylase [Deltaproteobacteria bacterium]